MSTLTTPSVHDPEALAREVLALREQVADLQRRLGRYAEAGGARPMSGMSVSISEREELLVEAERIAHMGSWVWDLESGAVSWSDELYRILGYDPEVDRPSADLYFQAIHPDDRAAVMEASREAAVTGIAPRADYRVLRRDGTTRHVLTHGAALFDEAGELKRIVGTLIDVTESREQAARLEHALQLLQDAQDMAQLGTWSSDLTRQTLSWSPELYRILGVPADAPPATDAFFARIHPDDHATLRAHVERLLAGVANTEPPVDVRVVRPDGGLRHVRIRSRSERDAEGRVVMRRGIVQDVTDAVTLHQRVARAEKMETIGRLAGGIAHEFNNIMTVIHVGADLLAESPEPDAEIIEQIRMAVASARELTSRLLAFGRQSTLRPRRVDVNDVVRDTLRLVTRILGAHITLDVVLEPDLPTATLDAHLTGQAIINLVLNARDAMPRGGRIVVSTRAVREARGTFVEVGVLDSGPGIDVALRDRIFEPFFTTKHEGHGTGLGLSMVQGAVEQQGGTVDFDSSPSGTLFVLRFPADDAAGAHRHDRAESGASARSLRILVVEDQESVAVLVQKLLERSGHRVTACLLPSQAITWYREHTRELDLVVSDVLMPEMSGVELVERLGHIAPLPAVLFMSGYGAEASHTLGRDRVVLSKPFTHAELLAAIARVTGEPLEVARAGA
ncbi:MAG: PAS domain-containing protein [Deltaproteobacteria bacterium]|nr:PAS domain-containing protein [Deltaproteobacteria bacterium]